MGVHLRCNKREPLETILQPHLNLVMTSFESEDDSTSASSSDGDDICVMLGHPQPFRGGFLLTFLHNLRAALVTCEVHTSQEHDVLAPAAKLLLTTRRPPKQISAPLYRAA
ncbi:hypothetical protein HPB52_009247 [Rhipicephalus sanguineus]|uniref:Uncharacterized protein n=1 Tax=Rhipicephalus sanguineus TaxID=34632 RepID=A0A9D4PKY0_RHISA|nr:hypothetical protein HPB52_009247 [Rhipicephalus sanguineus]